MRKSKINIKYALPLAQVIFAWMLLQWDHSLQNPANHNRCDMPGPSPPFEILFSINAPLLLPRPFWEGLFGSIWGYDSPVTYWWRVSTLICAVVFLWHWVALNVQAVRRRGTILNFTWRPARFLIDGLLVALGLLLGLLGAGKARVVQYLPWFTRWIHETGCYAPIWLELLSAITAACVLLCWSFALVFFYGRDFVHCARRTMAK